MAALTPKVAQSHPKSQVLNIRSLVGTFGVKVIE